MMVSGLLHFVMTAVDELDPRAPRLPVDLSPRRKHRDAVLVRPMAAPARDSKRWFIIERDRNRALVLGNHPHRPAAAWSGLPCG